MHFLNDSVGFIVGADGVFLKTYDRGLNWEKNIISGSDDLMSVFAINADTIFAGGENLYKSTDGGDTWNIIPTQYNIHEIKFFSQDTGYILIKYNFLCEDKNKTALIYRQTIDGGYSWQDETELNDNIVRSVINIVSRDTGYFVGNLVYYLYHCFPLNTSNMYKTTDGGNSWQEIYNRPSGHFNGASFLNGAEGYTSQTLYNDNLLYRMAGVGEEFIIVDTMDEYFINNLEFANFYEGYYSYEGRIMKTILGGISWEQDYNGPNNINGIKITINHEAYAIGNSGLILHKKLNPPTTVPLVNIDVNRLDYPNTNVGEKYYLSFTLHSTGLADIVVDISAPQNFLFKIEGSDEYINQIHGLIVPPKHDTTITVAFSPSAPQIYRDTVRISSNSINLPQILIPVTGKGIFRIPQVISNDTAFCADSIFLRNELKILQGASMTVCPGTIVVIPWQTPQQPDIVINGSLFAIGTLQDSIRFVSDKKNHEWDGIMISGDYRSDSVIMDYCVIKDTYRHENNGLDYGGGITITGNEFVSVRNSTIMRCRSNDRGGGIFCSSSNALIQNCNISSCQSQNGGGIYIEGIPGPNIEGCVIKDCSASDGNGGGIFSHASSPAILNNNIINNTADSAGGAIFLSEKATDNTARIIQNFIFNNSALLNNGGGIFIERQDADLILNTITGNSSAGTNTGGVFILDPDTVRFLGNIIYGNSHNQLITTDESRTLVNYSAIEGGFPGTGNVSGDPLFYAIGSYPWNLINNDYSLTPESPCIDAGIPDTTGLGLSSFDLAGNPRIYGDRIDIGAYENHFTFQTIDTGFCQGQEFRLEVDPAHEGTFTASWKFNGQPIYGAHNNYLVLSNPNENDEGYYDCTLEFPDFSLYSRQIYLYNKALAPVIKHQPIGADLNIGDSYTLQVDAYTYDHCIYFQWYRNDTMLADGQYSSYTVPYFRLRNAGTYKCWVYNTCGGIFSQDAVLKLYTIGIEEPGTGGILIYPNPAGELLTIDYPNNSQAVTYMTIDHFEITDLFGRKLIESYKAQKLPLNIDVSSLSPGMQILRITTRDGTSCRWKFLKL